MGFIFGLAAAFPEQFWPVNLWLTSRENFYIFNYPQHLSRAIILGSDEYVSVTLPGVQLQGQHQGRAGRFLATGGWRDAWPTSCPSSGDVPAGLGHLYRGKAQVLGRASHRHHS